VQRRFWRSTTKQYETIVKLLELTYQHLKTNTDMKYIRITIREQDNLQAITTLAEEDYEEFESFFTDAHQILDDLEEMRAKQHEDTQRDTE
jgi:hypothetical protein